MGVAGGDGLTLAGADELALQAKVDAGLGFQAKCDRAAAMYAAKTKRGLLQAEAEAEAEAKVDEEAEAEAEAKDDDELGGGATADLVDEVEDSGAPLMAVELPGEDL